MPAPSPSDEYRAIIFVILNGGNDGYNCVIPTDSSRYADYKAARTTLAVDLGPDSTIHVNKLLKADGTESGFGVNPRLKPLVEIWNAGEMNIIHNVGPLVRPLNQILFSYWDGTTVYNTKSADIDYFPQGLFAHDEQQIVWQNGQGTPRIPLGWGGASANRLGNIPTSLVDALSFTGNTTLGNGNLGGAICLTPRPGQTPAFGFTDSDTILTYKSIALKPSDNILTQIFASKQLQSFSIENKFGTTLQLPPSSADVDPAIRANFTTLDSGFRAQCFQVAKLLTVTRDKSQGNRHIFIISHGGYDTHTDQALAHPGLLDTIARSMSDLWKSIKALGLDNNVVIVTMSEFARTMRENGGKGTDHAWGNEQFVIGGSSTIKGGRDFDTIGFFPQVKLPSLDDASNLQKYGADGAVGRWIPTTSHKQYGATFMNWLNPNFTYAELNELFPNLNRWNFVGKPTLPVPGPSGPFYVGDPRYTFQSWQAWLSTNAINSVTADSGYNIFPSPGIDRRILPIFKNVNPPS
jgi:uncharacterized protein (DUF1501 family)